MDSSAVIFTNQHYTACAMRDGSLIVTRNRHGGGLRIPPAIAGEWVSAIKDAIDSSEAAALCRALLN